MRRLLTYFATLGAGRTILWCYAIWYAGNVAANFDASPRLWLTSLGLSLIVGVALVIGMRASSLGTTRLDCWQVLRLFLMPFCVSSFSALVKGEGYVLVFPPTLGANLVGLGAVAAFVAATRILRRPRENPGSNRT